MMDGTFVDAFANRVVKPVILEVGGKERLVIPANWTDVTPKLPQVAPLTLNTLTGLVDYLKENPDNLDRTLTFIQIVGPARVELRARLEGEEVEFRRRVHAVATTDILPKPFAFGQYYDAETFFIALATQFAPSKTRDDLMVFLKSIRQSTIRETTDQGVAQHVSVARGVSLVGDAVVPPRVRLAPYRTFMEVQQPESEFLLRLRNVGEDQPPQVILYEADGGAWKLAAVMTLKTYLTQALAGLGVAILG